MGGVAQAISGIGSSIGSAVSGVTSPLFGGRSDSGILGTGQFQANPYNIAGGDFAPNAQENDFTKALIARSNGQAPSVAELQLRSGEDQAVQNALALGASQRGINPGLAARMAAQQQSAIAQNTNQQAGILRAGEQQSADQLLGQELQSQRQGREDLNSLQVGQQGNINNNNQAGYKDAASRRGNLLGGIGSGVASFAAMAYGGMVPGYSAGGPVNGSTFSENLKNMMAGNSNPAGMTKEDDGFTKAGKGFGYALASKLMGGSSGASSLVAGGPMDPGGAASFGPALLAAASGGQVPGHASVVGNSKQNDVVPAMLSPGELVIPRTAVAQGPEAILSFAQQALRRMA